MLIEHSELWLAATNAYVVAPEAGGLAAVVDAPPDGDGVLDLLARYDLTPAALLITHGHVDHVGGAGQLTASGGMAAYIHPDDDFLTRDPEAQLRALFGEIPPGDYAPPAQYRRLWDGLSLYVAGIRFEVLHTPGHTPGHCCFHLPDEGVLFSGDQLFAGSIGRTDLPGGDYQTLLDSMEKRVLPLDDDTRVLPGHGPSTTIGRERRTNPFLFGLSGRGVR